MNTIDEWKIMIGSAERRQARGVAMMEDQTILEIAAALNYILSRITIDQYGNIEKGHGNLTENLENAINLGCFAD